MFRVIAVTGTIAAGKTTLARLLARDMDAVHLSSDAIRAELTGSPLRKARAVFALMEVRLLEALAESRIVVLDSTGMSERFRDLLSRYPYIVHVHLRCSESAYRKREALRTDRERPLPAAAYRRSGSIRFTPPPHLVLDTSELGVPEVYDAVRKKLRLG
jgi:shikimate kinase